MKKWSSHTVKTPTEIIHSASHPMNHDPKASQADTRTRAIFLLAAKKAPYHVYCNPFYEHAGYGNIFSVNSSGALDTNIQNYEYSPESAIHGMAFDPTESYLYSADMWGNKVWCHKKDAETGKLTLVGSVDAPKDHDQPRWVAVHPTGNYLYALMEHGNTLAVYLIDPKTHMPVYTKISYPLVPKCALSYNSHYNQYLRLMLCSPHREEPKNVPSRRLHSHSQWKLSIRNSSRQQSWRNRVHFRLQTII
jgi:carboxy-cis,cis-muconate cyclase